MEEFVLPEYWYLKLDNDNIELVKQWRKDKFGLVDDIGHWVYVNFRGGEWGGGGFCLTTEQFITHVLNQPSPNQLPEDYSYLIPILNKLNNG